MSNVTRTASSRTEPDQVRPTFNEVERLRLVERAEALLVRYFGRSASIDSGSIPAPAPAPAPAPDLGSPAPDLGSLGHPGRDPVTANTASLFQRYPSGLNVEPELNAERVVVGDAKDDIDDDGLQNSDDTDDRRDLNNDGWVSADNDDNDDDDVDNDNDYDANDRILYGMTHAGSGSDGETQDVDEPGSEATPGLPVPEDNSFSYYTTINGVDSPIVVVNADGDGIAVGGTISGRITVDGATVTIDNNDDGYADFIGVDRDGDGIVEFDFDENNETDLTVDLNGGMRNAGSA